MLTSWIESSPHSDFPIQNLPYGIFEQSGRTRAATRIGDTVIDLDALHRAGLFSNTPVKNDNIFSGPTLNAFMALGRTAWLPVRERLTQLFSADNQELQQNTDLKNSALFDISDVVMRIPADIGDYTDFYSSIEHATNMGKMFRDPDKALLPNWKHIPVGYNGRTSSIVVSPSPIRRPHGQTKADDADHPAYGPTKVLDIELEVGFFTGPATTLGEPIPIHKAHDHIFGMVLVNDWSARDIQKWEYVPLGPFLGKSFGTTISPWIVTLDALAPFRCPPPDQDPPILPYLQFSQDWALDLNLEVQLTTAKNPDPHTVARTNFKHMYWTMAQQLAHQTVNGTNINPGDLYASGTVSGPSEDSYGSFLELTWRGTRPMQLPSGEERKFLQDGDTVVLRGYGQGDGYRVGFGAAIGTITPALT